MEQTKTTRTPNPDPPAPVAGGIRWRKPYHNIFALCLRDKGLTPNDPDQPAEKEACEPEPGAITAPCIVSTPPAEARVGEEYVYQARAYDSNIAGFSWYFEKSVPGMNLDRHTGKVTWTPVEGGYFEVVICARSVYGAATSQCWTVCVRKAPAVRRFAVNARFREALRRLARRCPLRVRHFWSMRRRRRPGVDNRATAPPVERPRVVMPLRI